MVQLTTRYIQSLIDDLDNDDDQGEKVRSRAIAAAEIKYSCDAAAKIDADIAACLSKTSVLDYPNPPPSRFLNEQAKNPVPMSKEYYAAQVWNQDSGDLVKSEDKGMEISHQTPQMPAPDKMFTDLYLNHAVQAKAECCTNRKDEPVPNPRYVTSTELIDAAYGVKTQYDDRNQKCYVQELPGTVECDDYTHPIPHIAELAALLKVRPARKDDDNNEFLAPGTDGQLYDIFAVMHAHAKMMVKMMEKTTKKW